MLRDRQRRRIRLRRSLYVTAALAASVLIMLGIAYFNRPEGDRKTEPGPLAEQKKDVPTPPAPEKKKEIEKHDPPASLAALTGKLADKTLDQAKVLLAAANPMEEIPVANVNVPVLQPLDPAAEPLRQGAHDAGESVHAVTRSARRAFDYFAPMFDMPPAPENAAQK